mgnify:CR=1 FL=1
MTISTTYIDLTGHNYSPEFKQSLVAASCESGISI